MICRMPLRYSKTLQHDGRTMLDEHFQHIK